MFRMAVHACLLALLAAAGVQNAFAAATLDAFRAYAGEGWRGRVSVRVFSPEDMRDPVLQDTGSANALFVEDEEDEGVFTLFLIGNIEAEGDAGFTVTGELDEVGWHAGGDDVYLTVAFDGSIYGGGEQNGQRLTFEGEFTEDVFSLIAEFEMLQETDGGFPAGTIFRFTFDLSRIATGNAGADVERTCSNVVWQFRNIANLSGGPMGFIQVPVCVD